MRRYIALIVSRLAPGRRAAESGFYWSFALSTIVGISGALATTLFKFVIEYIDARIGQSSAASDLVAVAKALAWYWRIILPTLGGAIAGTLLMIARNYRRPDIADDYMDAVTLGNGQLGFRQSALTAGSSLISIASGSSIGREGPMVQLAALSASLVSKALRLTVRDARMIVSCGAAAGLTAAYNAPVAGALFVSELVLGSIAMNRFGPLLIAAVASNMTMRTMGDYHPTYAVPAYPSTSPGELAFFAVLGIVSGIAAPLFLSAVRSAKSCFGRLPLPVAARLALGGLIVGALSVECPEVWGNGFSVVTSILHNPWPWQMLLLILAAKVMATVASAGSGAVGGVFTPTLFVGAVVGCLFGAGVSLAPSLGLASQTAYAIAGMGATLAAATQAPLMAIVMLFEMTGDYQSVLPLIMSAVVASAVAHAIGGPVMYGVTVRRKIKDEERKRIAVGTVQELAEETVTTITTEASIADALKMFERYPVRYLYIVSQEGNLMGVVALRAVAKALLLGREISKTKAIDLLSEEVVTLRPDDTFETALRAFLTFPGERLPVVANFPAPRFIGVVRKTKLLGAYASVATD
ncbi:ClcB-like voltage-gated chloride channel protein [Paraburkholderia sp. MPAMCS5]|uniref:ClcB-like voltage-gated chloride channel protein n=1 Tax=Paraburkholderia sp. MPAMCS5 TaxID=3112563 RepID=UPI002E191574|nr:ClcB-like voltage-gated chloride channel protein [Paraburkholderia sp. MPAMCS5]